jgi:hypothetical protein
LVVLGAPRRQTHPAQAGATGLFGGIQIHQWFSLAHAYAKNRLWRSKLIFVQARSGRIRRRDREAAERLGVGLFLQPSRFPQDHEAGFHIDADLLKGTDENYRWTGVNWPDNRHIVITLSGDVSPNKRHGQIRSVGGWRCRYDLQKGTFDVPPEFNEHNAKAVGPDIE